MKGETKVGDTNIVYCGEFGIMTFKNEICAALGEKFWDELVDGITIPDIKSECTCQCKNMYLFMEMILQMMY